MPHILYLSYDGMTDPLGQSQVIPYLQGLSTAGYRISLISFEKDEQEAQRPTVEALLRESGIAWHPLSYTKNPPVFSTIKDIQTMGRKAAILHHDDPVQLVHCRSYISALVGIDLKQKYGIKFLFDMRGFWADERVEGGLWNKSNPLYLWSYQYFKKKELSFFQEADCTVSLTHAGKQEIHSWEGLKGHTVPIEVIPCCADLSLFDAGKQPKQIEVRASLGLGPEHFVLAYLGSVGTWYLLPEMLQFFKQLHQSRPQARFLFITPDDPEFIQREATHQGVDYHLLTIVKSPRARVPYFLKAADASIFFIKPSFSKKASSPTKQGEIMGMGMPIICNAGVGDTEQIVRQYQAGAVVKGFSFRDFKQVIDKIDALQDLDPARIRQGAQEVYALEDGVARYRAIYRRLLGG
jgi:glycosyltransferase involved in cell wall biosynthesis